MSSEAISPVTESSGHLEPWDYVVIVVYFSFVLAVGLWSSWRSKRDSVGGYFLASRSMNWVLVGASLFASNIGSGHFIGLAGSGAAGGIAIAGFELSAIFYIIFLGWCFVPVYMSSGVYTMPEYLRLRFGGQRIRIYLSVLALLLYVFTKISADLYAGALFITKATGYKGDGAIYVSILILLAIACLFTVAGGLSAVIWTDFIQTILMIIGAVLLAVLAFIEIGGYESLIDKYFEATATIRANNSNGDLCGGVPEDAMHLLRDATPGKSDLPWSGMTFGLAISSIWYWCSDQVIVQRALASKDMSHAKGACIFAGYLKLLPLFIMVLPGMAARVLYPDEVGCADPVLCKEICGSESGCTNMAFIKLVAVLMPTGIRGMMLAVMLAALMSSLTSIFNSSSTIFTMDIYPRFRPRASEAELLIVGRLFVLALVGVSIIWIPIIQASQGSQLFNYIQSITSYLAPPICAVYLLAIFWPRMNEPGAFWGLMIGLVVGLIRFGLEFGFTKPPCGSTDPQPPEWWYTWVDDIHYLHFGLLLWGISGFVSIAVSLMTPPPKASSLHRLTWWSKDSIQVREELDDEHNFQQDQNKPEPPIKSELSTWKKYMNYLCGVEMLDERPTAKVDTQVIIKSREEMAMEAAESLWEPEWKKNMVDANAVLLMAVAMFFWGFYA